MITTGSLLYSFLTCQTFNIAYIIHSLGGENRNKYFKLNHLLKGDVKRNSIFKDIAQIGRGEVNPMSKNWKENNFWQKFWREGVTKHIVKNWSTLFCITYSIWVNQFPSICGKSPLLFYEGFLYAYKVCKNNNDITFLRPPLV